MFTRKQTHLFGIGYVLLNQTKRLVDPGFQLVIKYWHAFFFCFQFSNEQKVLFAAAKKAVNEAKLFYLNCAISMRSETEFSNRIIKFYAEQHQKNPMKIPKSQRYVFWLKCHGLRKELFKLLKLFVFVAGSYLCDLGIFKRFFWYYSL